jgi:hypothetical protein
VRPRRLAVAVALALLSAVVALLAADVRAWRDAVRHDDAVYVAGGSGADWEPRALVPLAAAQRLLGVEPDVELRRALELVRGARLVRGEFETTEREGARGAAEAALVPIARGADPRRASQASALLGLLAFTDRRAGSAGAPPVARALAAFEQAYRLDRSNDVAKYDLELVQRLMQARGTRPGESAGAAPGGTGRRGAGSGRPGSGY